MTPELDRRLDAIARRRLIQLIDAIDVGPLPSRAAVVHPEGAQEDHPVVDLGTLTPVETEPPPQRPDRNRSLVFLAIAAAVAVVFGAVVAISALDDDSSPPAGDDGDVVDTLPRRLVPQAADLPAGLTDVVSDELPRHAVDDIPYDLALYGDGSDDAVGLLVLDGGLRLPGESTTVQGHDGVSGLLTREQALLGTRNGEHVDAGGLMLLGVDPGADGMRFVSWHVDGREIALLSRTRDAAALQDLADQVIVDGRSASLPAAAGLDLLVAAEDIVLGSTTPSSDDVKGLSDSYLPHRDFDERPQLRVTVEAAPAASSFAISRWLGNGRLTEVRGTQAWVREISSEDDTGVRTYSSVMWSEEPDVINRVDGYNIPLDQLIRITEGLRPAIGD